MQGQSNEICVALDKHQGFKLCISQATAESNTNMMHVKISNVPFLNVKYT